MPKNKAKGKKNRGAWRALGRTLQPDLPAIKAVAESCDQFRDEWRECGGDPSKWQRVVPWPAGSGEGVCALFLSSCSQLVALPDAIGDLISIRELDLVGCNNLRAAAQSLWSMRPRCLLWRRMPARALGSMA